MNTTDTIQAINKELLVALDAQDSARLQSLQSQQDQLLQEIFKNKSNLDDNIVEALHQLQATQQRVLAWLSSEREEARLKITSIQNGKRALKSYEDC